jgi:hypothetical protein
MPATEKEFEEWLAECIRLGVFPSAHVGFFSGWLACEDAAQQVAEADRAGLLEAAVEALNPIDGGLCRVCGCSVSEAAVESGCARDVEGHAEGCAIAALGPAA